MKAGKLIAAVFVGFSGALLACASILGFKDDLGPEGPDSGSPDVDRPDTGPCGWDKEFGTPIRVDLGREQDRKWGGWLSDEERRIHFASFPEGSRAELYFATRNDSRGPFGPPQSLGCCNAGSNEVAPTLTDDRKVMVFAASVDAGVVDGKPREQYNLFIARGDTPNRFADAMPLSSLNTNDHEWAPFLDPTGQKIWFSAYRNGDRDISVAAFTADGGVGRPISPAGINVVSASDDNPVLSADGHNIYFSSSRGGEANISAVWVAHRDDVSNDFTSWGTPKLAGVQKLEPDDQERPIGISRDECRLYYMVWRSAPDDKQIYMVERKP